LYLDSSNNATISGNSITNSNGDGLDIDGVNGATITGNTIGNNAEDGIWIGNASNISIAIIYSPTTAMEFLIPMPGRSYFLPVLLHSLF